VENIYGRNAMFYGREHPFFIVRQRQDLAHGGQIGPELSQFGHECQRWAVEARATLDTQWASCDSF
jgi:hypothetical protein